MKVIRYNTPKGQFYVPLETVAENRADYYSVEVDGNEKWSDEYKEEVKFVMEDSFEGIDWLINNSNEEDWKTTKLNEEVKTADEDYWFDSDNFEIIEI